MLKLIKNTSIYQFSFFQCNCLKKEDKIENDQESELLKIKFIVIDLSTMNHIDEVGIKILKEVLFTVYNDD